MYTRVSPTWIKYNPVIPSGFAIASGLNGLNAIGDLSGLNVNGLNGIGALNGMSAMQAVNGMACTQVNTLNGINGMNGMNGMANGMANGMGIVNGSNGINGLAGISAMNGMNALGNLAGCQALNGMTGMNGIHTVNGLNGHSNGTYTQHIMEQDRQNGQNGVNGHTENVHWSPPYPMVCLPDSSYSTGLTQTNGVAKMDNFPPQITFQVTGAPRPNAQNTATNATTVCTSVFAPITTANARNHSMGNPLTNSIQTMQFSRPMPAEFTSPFMKFVAPATFLPIRPSTMASVNTITHG